MIYQLGIECFNWIIEKVTWDFSLIAWFHDNHRELCFIAEEDNHIVGFVLAFTRFEIGYIGWIAIADRHRRHGIGTQLLRKAVKELRRKKGIQSIAAHVRAEEPTQGMFKKCNFTLSDQNKVEMVLPV